MSTPALCARGGYCRFVQQDQLSGLVLQVLFTMMSDAIRKVALDMVPEATGEMASLPARLYSGQGGDTRYFRKVAFRTPLVHDSDHRTVVATFRARKTKWLTKYCCRRQHLPLRLAPKTHDELTHTFKALKLTCKKAKPTKNSLPLNVIY